MAGRGPAPKDGRTRARRNKDTIPTVRMSFVAGTQPELPEGIEWPQVTRDWWAAWGRSPQADLFGEMDWFALLEAAVLHAKFWTGDMRVVGELRLRTAKFGATPEDRARLRWVFAEADISEAEASHVAVVATEQQLAADYGGLALVKDATGTG